MGGFQIGEFALFALIEGFNWLWIAYLKQTCMTCFLQRLWNESYCFEEVGLVETSYSMSLQLKDTVTSF